MRQHFSFFDKIRPPAALALTALLALSLGGCREKDPHAGMVQVHDGQAMVWVTPWDGAAVNPRTAADFYTPDDGDLVSYTGEGYTARQGVDVSYFQDEIDWEAVAADGIEFAIIRAGYRGYTDGYINMDQRFPENVSGALAAGLDVGLYFFSQATTADEALEEAQWLIEAARRYDVTLPLVFDWENIGESPARTDGIPGRTVTEMARVFCDEILAAGYTPGVYFNRWQGCYEIDLGQLQDAALWLTADDVADDWYYDHCLWQYTYTGSVRGIGGPVDRDLMLTPAE